MFSEVLSQKSDGRTKLAGTLLIENSVFAKDLGISQSPEPVEYTGCTSVEE